MSVSNMLGIDFGMMVLPEQISVKSNVNIHVLDIAEDLDLFYCGFCVFS